MNSVYSNNLKMHILNLVMNAVSLLIFILFSYNAFYDLFIYVEKVHYPLILLDQVEGSPFSISNNVPTVCNMIILVISLVGIYSSIMIFFIKMITFKKKFMKYWVILISCFFICALCELVLVNDFFSHAFDGVG
jgi:hypothetical protein